MLLYKFYQFWIFKPKQIKIVKFGVSQRFYTLHKKDYLEQQEKNINLIQN